MTQQEALDAITDLNQYPWCKSQPGLYALNHYLEKLLTVSPAEFCHEHSKLAVELWALWKGVSAGDAGVRNALKSGFEKLNSDVPLPPLEATEIINRTF